MAPDLIIADEPTTALDVTIQAQILHLLAELQSDFDMAMILITHDLGIVARVADKVQVMYAGRTVEEGNCEAVFDNLFIHIHRGCFDVFQFQARRNQAKTWYSARSCS